MQSRCSGDIAASISGAVLLAVKKVMREACEVYILRRFMNMGLIRKEIKRLELVADVRSTILSFHAYTTESRHHIFRATE